MGKIMEQEKCPGMNGSKCSKLVWTREEVFEEKFTKEIWVKGMVDPKGCGVKELKSLPSKAF